MMEYKNGDVVYFRDGDVILVGVVDVYISERDLYYIDLIQLADHRYVDGIPIQDLPFESEWRKLPKGWTYNTELFSIEDRVPDYEVKRRKELRWTVPEDVRTALREGVCVLSKNVFHGVVEAQVDRQKGFRVVKKYPHWTLNYGQPNKKYRRVPSCDVCSNYCDALDRLSAIKAERERVQNLSDDEWSWEEIEKVLKRVGTEYADRCRKFFRTLTDIADVEIKVVDGAVHWRRFEKRTKWAPVP